MGGVGPLPFGNGNLAGIVAMATQTGIAESGVVVRIVIDLGGQFVASGAEEKAEDEGGEDSQ